MVKEGEHGCKNSIFLESLLAMIRMIQIIMTIRVLMTIRILVMMTNYDDNGDVAYEDDHGDDDDTINININNNDNKQ